MLTYENHLTADTMRYIKKFIPSKISGIIAQIVESSPDSSFYCNMVENSPSVDLFVFENNDSENYNVCHFISFDRIGSDYLYQTLSFKQIKHAEKFIQHASKH